jgi:hypothetical protein
MNDRDKPLLFDQPGCYRISVQGQISTSWSSRLSDMKITVQNSESQQPVTTLSGELRDQAALMGVLNALYDMQCLVLKVEQLDITLPANDPPSDERKQSE